VRLKAFVDGFGAAGSSYSICDDMTVTMQAIGRRLATRAGLNCLPVTAADIDLGRPGTQLDCAVEELIPLGPTYRRVPVPACASATTQPCWTTADAAACPSRLSFVLEGGPQPPGSAVTVDCRAK
jgi:hypothetical protein